MSLPAHLLREMLMSLKSDPGAPRTTANKRRAPRVGFRKPIKILPLTDPASDLLPCWVRNLSGTGIGLLARRSIPVGTQFILRFTRPDAEPLLILYRTTHLMPVGTDSYIIGARLVRMMEPLDPPLTTPRAAS